MSKDILFGTKAQSALKKGIDAVADAVKITIGPRGRNVVLGKSYGGPTITNDGVSIAKDIELEGKFEDMGASIIKEVADKTNETAGDGTSTSVILTQSMITEGLLRTSMGANGVLIRHGIEAAARDAVEALRSMSKKVKGTAEIKQVATISAESEELGGIIAETIEKVGLDGVVTVEESQSFGVESEVVEGVEFDKGYISPYMVTNHERMEAEHKETPILITDQKISQIKEVLPVIENLAQNGQKDLIIIADDVDGEALATFVVNKLRGALNVLAIKAPGFGDAKKDQLEDIAISVGATVISSDKGMKLEEADVSMLGKAHKVISKKDSTIIVGGAGSKKDITARIAQLKNVAENMDSKFDREKLEKRIAKLAGGIAVIRVGAATETEMKYLKLKIEDSVNATRAAIEEGIVPGGGSALVLAAKTISAKYDTLKESDEFMAGYRIVIDALTAPLKQIAINAGKDDGSVKVYEVQNASGIAAGYDALTDTIIPDMFKAGIIDPVKVTRTALQNAASAAGTFLTTEVAIADAPKKEDNSSAPQMGGGMPGMGGMM